ncbi:hypothetical protein BGZ98_007829 [Dissophora globulifera]|nr:hypothetical protein BGZ98_007829 [Dissophora globulifera]
MDLQCDVVMFSGPSIDVFQHQKIRTLVAPIKQVFKPDSQHEISPLGSSLLSHFPNLLKWHCYDRQTTLSVPFQRIKAEVDICCPKMSQIDTWKTPSPALYDILANAFRNLKFVTFEYEQLSRDIIMALLFHQSTLLYVSATSDTIRSDIEQDEIFSVDDPFEIHGRALQLLPRTCSSLTVLNLECHKMDMDHVEEEEWACKGLQQLRVRFKDLNTQEKVATALQLWTEGRNKSGGDGDDLTHGEHETDLQMRVARHLLKFKRLHSVWLGTHVYYV